MFNGLKIKEIKSTYIYNNAYFFDNVKQEIKDA